MKYQLTGFDLANTVRMAHTQRQICFLLVEGETDLLCLVRFLDSTASEVLVCHGRRNAIAATQLLDATREAGFVTVIDADFDHLRKTANRSENCILTEYHDLIVVLVCSEALNRVLAERGSNAKIGAFEDRVGMPVREALLTAASPMGYVRWVSEAEGLGLTFNGIDLARLVDEETLTLDLRRCVEVVAQRSGRADETEDINRRCERLAQEKHDTRQVSSGHDVIAVLGIGLRKVLGSQRATDVRMDTLELELRLAFDPLGFGRTALCEGLLQWQARNPGWRVLAA